MRKIIKYSSVALLLVLISCNTQKSSKTKNSNLVNNTVVNYKDGLIDFSFDYFKQLVKTDNKNICTSPLSLSLAMGMIYEGADENTYAQIANAMNFPADISNFYNTVSEYYSQIEAMSTDTNMEMNIVNRVYIEESLKVNSKYINNVSKNFKAKVEDVNFIQNFKAIEKEINKWVEKETRDKIVELIPQGTLDNLTRMVLVNALYFKSPWLLSFNEAHNIKKDFRTNENHKTKTTFMVNKSKRFRYFEDEQKQIIDIPYETPQISLMIILPRHSNNENIDNFIPSGEDYLYINEKMYSTMLDLEIPKFKISSDFDLEKTLTEMGIKDAFNDDLADFSTITKKERLKIDKVIQKVVFEIDEKGTEAAAASAIVMTRVTSVMPSLDDNKKQFIADHPFIFILKENKFNTPLFVGKFIEAEQNL